MISIREIESALKGSWLLFLNRREGLKWFDFSVGGFWRSFSVIVLLLPLFWMTSLAERKLLITETDLAPEFLDNAGFWGVRLVGFALDWLALPVLLAFLARPLGIAATYPSFMVVRNWTSLFVAIPYVLSALFFQIGLISGGVMYLLWLCLLVMTLWYRFLIARMIFRSSISLVLGIVFLDIVLSIFIQAAVDHLY